MTIIFKFIRRLLLWFKQLFETFHFFASLLYHSNLRNYNEYMLKKRPLAIFGNGPSLNAVLSKLDIVNNYDICCVNFSASTDIFYQIKPSMLVFADRVFWYKTCASYEKVQSLYAKLNNNVDWSLKIYIPYTSLKKQNMTSIFKGNPNIKIVYYHNIPWNGFEEFRNMIYKKGWSMPPMYNVMIACIHNAINSGYKHIQLYGVDHSWINHFYVNETNKLMICDTHYYEKEKPPMTPVLNYQNKELNLHTVLRKLAYTFEGYHTLRNYAEYMDVKILNCTKGSYIDAFDRDSD